MLALKAIDHAAFAAALARPETILKKAPTNYSLMAEEARTP